MLARISHTQPGDVAQVLVPAVSRLGAGRNRRSRKVVEIVQYGARVPSARQPFPELWCNAGIVLKLAKGIEPGETRNEDDVATRRGTPNRRCFGWRGSILLFRNLRYFRI